MEAAAVIQVVVQARFRVESPEQLQAVGGADLSNGVAPGIGGLVWRALYGEGEVVERAGLGLIDHTLRVEPDEEAVA
jgi:hypothetical protein